VKKFAHLSYLIAMFAEAQHFAKAFSTPIVMTDLMLQL
jgi:hypothetical protein